MTRFEASVIMFSVAAIAFILVIAANVIVTRLNSIIRWKESIWQELRRIYVNVADTAEYTHNHIAPDVESISNNILRLIDDGPTKIDWDELSKQQQDEFRKWIQMVNIDKLNKEDKD